MELVRSKSGAAAAGDFVSRSGSPIVIDEDTGKCYVIKVDGTIIEIGAGTYGPIASPTFTGTPAAPTASASTDSTQIATTAHVKDYAPSGFWTPTLTNATNIAASTAYECQYIRIGDIVTCGGRVDVDVTSAGAATVLGMSLPIESAFTAPADLAGSIVQSISSSAGGVGAFLADETNDIAVAQWFSVGAANAGFFFNFIYRVRT